MTLLLLLASCSLFVSCATIPDSPSCVEINPTQGFCVHALSAKEFFVDDAHPFGGMNWQKLKGSSVIVPPSSWAELKAYILKRCVNQGDCDELEEPLPGEEAIKKLDKRRK